MATVNKDFKIKSGLVVEGTTGTINGLDILTKKQADQDYIVSLIGGTATPDNEADTVVKRDETGSFAANEITVNELIIGEIGRIYDDSELLIAASEGEDIKLTADDVRIEAVDDFRVNVGGDILLDASEPGMGVYVGSVGTGNKVVTEAIMDSHIGDNTVDGTTGNTITDRIASASQDLTDHENATVAHGATGAVVGTTNEQTLTNKTISYTDNTLTVQVANVSDLTASASELNLLDGVTATTAELNYVDGVTSGIQGQLDDKAPLDSPALTGTPTAPTATAGTNTTQVATTAFVGTAVSNLVGSAPELLNTLQELAAAIDNDPETINNLQSLAAGKQDNLTAGDNISIDGSSVISVTGLDSADISDFSSAAVTANTGLWDTIGDAADAEQNAKDYADGLINDASNASDEVWSAYKTSTEIGLAQQAAIDAANDLTTDDVEEGSAQYFTDVRAKISAAALLTGASKTNIQITGDENGLTITAENGVADSTTDNLSEGTTNKYFTAQRAVDALEAVVPNFTAVEINSVAKQVAAKLEAETLGIQVAYAWNKSEYRSAEFLVKVETETHSEISKVLLTLAGNDNISITEYGIVGTNGSMSSISAVISGTDVQLQVTTTNNNSVVTVMGTLLN
jgi:hypothetical protein